MAKEKKTVKFILGSYVAFILSWVFGRPFVEKFVNKSIIERFDYFLHKKSTFLGKLFKKSSISKILDPYGNCSDSFFIAMAYKDKIESLFKLWHTK